MDPTKIVPADHSSSALVWVLSIGGLALVSWLVKWICATLATKLDTQVSETRGVKEALLSLPEAFARKLREMRDEDRRAEGAHVTAHAERTG